MKILLLADHADPMLWEHLDRRRLEGVDLILSCGDLPADYLSFLTCFTHAPILYIHGNHDTRYARKPPEGCTCIEDSVYVHEGVRILGLGGSMRYNAGAHQYTEK
ncbi:MAG: metallophosphoesterase, partial [Clostridia bacterium]|nr:metallophosphoesterase [Clostridia bacterium]